MTPDIEAALETVKTYLELNGEFPRVTLAEALVQSGVMDAVKRACDEFIEASKSRPAPEFQDEIEEKADCEEAAER